MAWTLHEGDCLDIMPQIPTESVHLVFADPPYNIGKAEWDRIDDYLGWCEKWIAECSRILRPNGAFWVSHSDPDVLVEISRIIERHGRKRINWVTWDKYNGATSTRGFMDGFTVTTILCSFQPMAEYLVFHADEGEWERQTHGDRDQTRGVIFEPLRAYLDGERERAGLAKPQVDRGLGFNDMARHWFSRSQWALPTAENYRRLRELFGEGHLTRDYTDLQCEYSELKAEYDKQDVDLIVMLQRWGHLRYTFNNPGKVSSVWQFDPAPRNGHPTPKPEPLLERIILTCTNPGDVVLDPFAGSGTTLAVAERLGRESIGIEIAPGYCELIRRRLEKPPLFAQADSPVGNVQEEDGTVKWHNGRPARAALTAGAYRI